MDFRHSLVVQIKSLPDVILSAIVFPDSVQVQAGVSRLEMSSTSLMSLPAIGFGTDGVMATSLAAHGPEGCAARVTGSSIFLWCLPSPLWRGVTGALEVGAEFVGPASATFVAVSPPEPSLDPPSILAMPTTSSIAMPSTISRRTQ